MLLMGILVNLNKSKSDDAFTLIEVLTAVAIFGMFISVFAGFLVGSIRSQQRALSSQRMVDSVSYNLEYISRALRMARKDHTGDCLIGAGAKHNYETDTVNRNRIRFLNHQNRCQEFFLEEGRLKERRSTDHTAVNFGAALPLTPSAINVVSFKLGPSDSWGQAQGTQPRVTFSLRVEKAGGISMNVQTIISQRSLNIIQ